MRTQETLIRLGTRHRTKDKEKNTQHSLEKVFYVIEERQNLRQKKKIHCRLRYGNL